MTTAEADALPLYIVDAFAERPFAGNPPRCACCKPGRKTLFCYPSQPSSTFRRRHSLVGSGQDYAIRWFTPTKEVDLIGHATLAAAHVVFSRAQDGLSQIRFRSGPETILVAREDNLLAMDFPALASRPVEDAAAVIRALLATPRAVFAGKHYMALFDTAEQVGALKVDMPAVAALDLPAVIVTAPSTKPGIDFVSRFFAPANGVPEDAVSGVAHLALVPFWSRRLGKVNLTGRQLSSRGGIVMGLDRGQRVTLMGNAVQVLAGKVFPGTPGSLSRSKPVN